MLGIESFSADAAGYEELLGWLASFGVVTLVGVEGIGSWGVGLARFLHDQEVETVEVDRPNRQKAPQGGQVGSHRCQPDAGHLLPCRLSAMPAEVPRDRTDRS